MPNVRFELASELGETAGVDVTARFEVMTLAPIAAVPDEELTALGRMVYTRALEKAADA